MKPSPEPPEASALAALRLAFTWGYWSHRQPQRPSVDLCNACRESIPVRLTLMDRLSLSLDALFFDPHHHPSTSLYNGADSGSDCGSYGGSDGGGFSCSFSSASTSRLASYQRVESMTGRLWTCACGMSWLGRDEFSGCLSCKSSTKTDGGALARRAARADLS